MDKTKNYGMTTNEEDLTNRDSGIIIINRYLTITFSIAIATDLSPYPWAVRRRAYPE